MLVPTKAIKFLKSVEGNKYTPYVPRYGRSGVTLGIGVDLAHTNTTRLDIPCDIKERLAIYRGITGEDAAKLLRERPLPLKREEVDLISVETINLHAKELADWYDRDSKINFNSLTENQKCVLLSVKYQYGNLPKRTPKFWGFATANDWESVYYELMEFGDNYKTRRHREARLIAQDFESNGEHHA